LTPGAGGVTREPLIGLTPNDPTDSVRMCPVPTFRRLWQSSRPASATRRRVGHTWRRAGGRMGISARAVSTPRPTNWLRGVWQSKACGDGVASDPDAVHALVLDDVLGDYPHAPGSRRGNSSDSSAWIGMRRPGPSWALLHKLRRAMVRPDREPLKDQVEVDEAYIGGPEVGLHGGRELIHKALVVAAVWRCAGAPRAGSACRSSRTPRAGR
jgi:hypothetical protein